MNDVTNGTIWSFILIAIITIDAFITLLTMLNKGIFIDRRKQLMSKTNKELKQLLVGVKNISKLRKEELVDLVLEVTG
tara:strand:- start:393 stop:626 length:234 start_codon:yes stop_codon:yes gene_type:complete